MTMVRLAVALLVLATTRWGALAVDPNTPVQTVDGQTVPLSHCLFKAELSHAMQDIGRQMTAFGISPPVANDYQTYVTQVAAKAAAANNTVVCLSPAAMMHVGRRLGALILQHVEATGPTKRRRERGRGNADGARTGTGFRFDGDRDDSFDDGGIKCCRCDRDEYVFDAGNKCPAGPCCPQLCEALWAIAAGASDGPDECCLERGLRCLHERGDANAGGARGNRAKFS